MKIVDLEAIGHYAPLCGGPRPLFSLRNCFSTRWLLLFVAFLDPEFFPTVRDGTELVVFLDASSSEPSVMVEALSQTVKCISGYQPVSPLPNFTTEQAETCEHGEPPGVTSRVQRLLQSC